MPCTCDGKGNYEIVKGLNFEGEAKARLDKTVAELAHEAELVAPLLK